MTNEELAASVRAWRGGVPRWIAADALGLSPRTLEHIEYGRGFRHPRLLRLAMTAINANGVTNIGKGKPK
jgi:hypothetical protein